MPDKLFLLDAMALVYRAHFALIRNPIRTTGGMNTSAVFGFTNTLLSILENEKPTHIAVAFDTPEPTRRHEVFEDYKATREEMPEDIIEALPYIDRILEAFGIPLLRAPGYEADDIIGTLARQAAGRRIDTFMVTPDKDFAQLVDEHTRIFKPSRHGSGFEILGVAEILEAWGVERVEQVIDVLGLWGDAVDNVPGIPGIGEKTAKKLVELFGSVENLIANADQLKGKQKENVETYAEQGLLSKRLVTINCEVPLDTRLEDLKRGERNDDAVKQLLVELEFNALGQRLFGEGFQAGRGKGARDTTPAASEGREEQGELFAQTLKTIDDVNHEYEWIDDDAGRDRLAKTLSRQGSFCFDTETTGLNAHTAELVALSFSWKHGTASVVPVPADSAERELVLETFRPVFEDPDVEKIGHNLKFDLKVLRRHGVRVRGALVDTMLAHALTEPDQRHGMDFLAEAYLGYSPIPISRLIGEKKGEQRSMRDVPPDELVTYAAEDADITLQLAGMILPDLKKRKQDAVFSDIESRLLPVLVEVEIAGIAVDTKALEEFSKTLATQIEHTRKEVFELAGTEFNLNSPKQLGEILFDRLKLLDKPRKTKTGQYQTNEQVLIGLAPRHRIVRLILDYREATKLKSTYVDTLPGYVLPTTGRVHTTFGQLATATGRLVSSNPNLQNIPIRSEQGQEIRRAFVPRDEGHVLVSADYSQIELRIMAELSGDRTMIEAFESGQDIHAATASRVHGVALENVTPDMRRQAKMINYGLMYGMSVFGLSQRLGVPRKEAGEIVDQYFNQFSGIRKYIDDTIAFARKNGYVQTIRGRRRYLRDIDSRNQTTRGAAERNAVNTPIQGSGADLIKTAMIDIHDAFESAGLRSSMVLQIHDELLFDVVEDEVEDVKRIVVDRMVHAIPMKVPIEVDVGVGDNWLEAH